MGSGKFFRLGRGLVSGLSLGLFLAHGSVARAASTGLAGFPICPDVRWTTPRPPVSFSGVETLLICGDLSGKGAQAHAWRNIPNNQSRFHLTTFLQDRGYFNPSFDVRLGILWVNPGPKSFVRRIVAPGAPSALHLERRRGTVGAVLTPRLLDQIEDWVAHQLQDLGYPCPVVRARANAVLGNVEVDIESGPKQIFGSIRMEPIAGMHDEVLRRYDAFRLGDRFRGYLLALTQRRILNDGVLQSVHLTPSCGPLGAIVREDSVPGPPRLLTAGFGFNTEVLILGRVTWKNARLGPDASALEFIGELSKVQQRLQGIYTWYPSRRFNRAFLRPSLELLHDNEKYYESLTAHLAMAPGTSWDFPGIGITLDAGPALDLIRTIRGAGPRFSRLVSLETNLAAESHRFEYYLGSPRTGYRLSLLGRFSRRELLSDVSAQRLGLEGEYLLNFRHLDPPLLVFGLRGAIRTTITGEDLVTSDIVPSTFRQYLGGSADLRGFGRNELPSVSGGLSAAFGSLETRLVSVLPLQLQPFAFVDAGALGHRPTSLDAPVYWSPGIGMRWESPIGNFRFTVAHGYGAPTGSGLNHFQLYLSYGEEF